MKNRRLAASLAVVLPLLVVAAFLARGGEPRFAPAAGTTGETFDPLAFEPDREAQFERRAAAGLSHVLYAKSPGGVVASAERTARWRPLVDEVAAEAGLDPEIIEAIVFLESAGRPEARASNDLKGAVGLTQILAETGRNLLRMRVDVAASTRLTRDIARGRNTERARESRAIVDERFDPRKALEGTARYLTFAKGELGRDDLAVVSYHMGVGNLQNALSRYGGKDVSYARLYFDSTPIHHAEAWSTLAALGDDSSTYYWRILASKEIMRLFRDDPGELERRASLHARKNSAEELLHPPDGTTRFLTPDDVTAARETDYLAALPEERLAEVGVAVGDDIGEIAPELSRSRALYRALRPQAVGVLETIGAGVREIAGDGPALRVTSAARDEEFQDLLADREPQATEGYSLHTTGYAFDIARDYASNEQARAFQFMLDRLTALNVIAWVREPRAIHITVARDGLR